MRRIIILSIITFVVLVVLPWLIVMLFSHSDDEVRVYIADENRVVTMDRAQYLKEVVAAEMPAEFNPEALAAQAVAARTYLASREGEYKDVHRGADICTDSTHCKAWISEEQRRKSWGTERADEYWQKISYAVDVTDGEMIYYNNEPISAVFFSTSAGRTESAADVWGGRVDYLVSVESHGEEASPSYKSQKRVSIDEFKKTVEQNTEGAVWDGELWGMITYTDGGAIREISIGKVAIKGTELRRMFDLKSAHINLSLEADEVVFDVCGNGHGVGMSQYGANHLANSGMGYRDILKFYYTGVEIR